MDPRPLVVLLEMPYAEYRGEVPVKDILLAGLRWETQHWPSLAVEWLEQGAPLDAEIKEALDGVASRKHFPQPLRHKAFAIARRWERRSAESSS